MRCCNKDGEQNFKISLLVNFPTNSYFALLLHALATFMLIYIYAYHYTIVYGVLQAVVPHEIFQLLKTINQVSVPLN